ncbi:MAG: dTDP-4-dehydrorhamnose reductase [Gemmatimonadaceae bacterium]|nr:dTDP-4-dehydrorhamnose reductase [Gemmatimonadaceae bacterium]
MRAVIVGAAGQLGRALVASAPRDGTCIALTSADLDIADRSRVDAVIDAHRPDVILNAAAYTAVDAAEQDRERAHAVNAAGPAHLARAARACGARLVHVSTDYVFDGRASRPYRPDDATAPLNVYGATKRAGEVGALEAHADVLVVRTSWVYGARGRNFVHTMLRLMHERGAVRVVADQVGAPTWTGSLASLVWAAAGRGDISGIAHWCDAGVASWYDFAVAIAEEGVAARRLATMPAVEPIDTAAFPQAARRPGFSLLDVGDLPARLGVPRAHWRASLRSMLAEPTDG